MGVLSQCVNAPIFTCQVMLRHCSVTLHEEEIAMVVSEMAGPTRFVLKRGTSYEGSPGDFWKLPDNVL